MSPHRHQAARKFFTRAPCIITMFWSPEYCPIQFGDRKRRRTDRRGTQFFRCIRSSLAFRASVREFHCATFRTAQKPNFARNDKVTVLGWTRFWWFYASFLCSESVSGQNTNERCDHTFEVGVRSKQLQLCFPVRTVLSVRSYSICVCSARSTEIYPHKRIMGILDALSVVCLSIGLCESGILDVNWARSDKIGIEVNFNLPWLPFENETRCYDELGCLNITRSWYHLINRPFNVFPLPRSVINTRFILYTRLNPFEGQVIKAKNESIEKSNLDVQKKTKFIIHGFIDTPLSNWVKDMKDELLRAEDANVIVVDWAGGSLPLYTQATANTRLVGLEIGHLINYLVSNYDMDAKNVHIIGHSLGAHTAGYAGSMVSGLGRITGLDPAEPYFQGMPSHVRLDPSDAELVDVIHTDGKGILFLGYGMSQPCGHLDFYPNDGKEQPGCDITQTPLVPLTLIRDGLEEASRVLVACNHVRAIKLFIDSINTQCPYIGRQCSNFKQFMSGKCFDCKSGMSCAVMGYKADTSLGFLENEVQPHTKLQEAVGNKYFLATGRDYPFCQQLYKVTVDLAHPAYAEDWVQGRLKASMYSPNGVIRVDLTPSETKLAHGSVYTTVVAHPVDLAGTVRKVELNWIYDMNVLEPKTLCLFWCNDHLYVRSVTVDQLELPGRGKRDAKFNKKLCSKGKKDYADISSNGRGVFVESCSITNSENADTT